MPKTKDAFALRGFDEKRILQRRWFKDFNLPVEDDKYVFDVFYYVFEKPLSGVTPSGKLKRIMPTEEGYLAGIEENLLTVKRLYARTENYLEYIVQHITLLHKIRNFFAEKFIATEERIYKEKIIRADYLIKGYEAVVESIVNIFIPCISNEVLKLEGLLNESIRKKFFGARLRQARREARLTQAKLAKRVGLQTYAPITQYERGINDPSLPTLFRIATALNRSTDWLLGLK